jgi:hypothetical protein
MTDTEMAQPSFIPPMTLADRVLLRIGAISSVLGLVLSSVAAYFHGGTHPADLQAALPEYAANTHWELVHLVQFGSDVLMLIAFLALYRSILEGASVTFARIAMAVALVAEAIYGANQAVDGIAIKYVAQQWVTASIMEKPQALRIAEAVRHIEIGLSSIWTLTGGISLLFFGVAMTLGREYPKLLGWSGVILGLLQIALSFDLARHGFMGSPLAMVGLLIAPWTLWLAFSLWRKAAKTSPASSS